MRRRRHRKPEQPPTRPKACVCQSGHSLRSCFMPANAPRLVFRAGNKARAPGGRGRGPIGASGRSEAVHWEGTIAARAELSHRACVPEVGQKTCEKLGSQRTILARPAHTASAKVLEPLQGLRITTVAVGSSPGYSREGAPQRPAAVPLPRRAFLLPIGCLFGLPLLQQDDRIEP